MTGFEAFVYEELDGNYSGSDEVQVDCIDCGKEKHMYVNIRTGLAHCFVCGYSANVIKLLMDVRGVEVHHVKKEAESLLSSAHTRLAHRTSGGKGPYFMDAILRELYQEDAVKVQMKLPKGTYSISPGDCAADYLYDRRIKSAKTIRRHGLMRCLLGTYLHIVFPDYAENGKLRYYTTRNTWWDKERSKAKALHPKGISKPYLFGECFLRTKQSLILVEGPMDALALSGWACPLLGKFLSKDSAEYIANKFRRVVLALDADAQDDAMVAAEMLINVGVPDVRVWNIAKYGKYDDPADLYQRSNTTHNSFALWIFRTAERINLSDRVRAALPPSS